MTFNALISRLGDGWGIYAEDNGWQTPCIKTIGFESCKFEKEFMRQLEVSGEKDIPIRIMIERIPEE